VSHNKMTMSKVVASNVEVYMRWRGFNQEQLADRMTAVGMGFDKRDGGRTAWHRRTVGQLLSGRRRIDIDELFGLAGALETTVGALLSPRVGGVADFDVTYVIGDLYPIGMNDVEILLEDMDVKEARPRLVLDSWPTGSHSEGIPRWVKTRDALEQRLFDQLEALKAEHPDVDLDSASLREIFALFEEHGDSGDDMD
jgi:transcriptional regulator with XRE-family HTH domain